MPTPSDKPLGPKQTTYGGEPDHYWTPLGGELYCRAVNGGYLYRDVYTKMTVFAPLGEITNVA